MTFDSLCRQVSLQFRVVEQPLLVIRECLMGVKDQTSSEPSRAG